MKKLKDGLEILLKNAVFGDHIHIEASTLCQLKCPVCIQTNGEANILDKGYLKFRNFKRFIDDNPGFKSVELSNYGEMFLNPELDEIIRYAYKKNVYLRADNGVNLNTACDEILEALVKYRFKLIRVSIDGASDQTYRIYRIGGDFNRVIKNIEKINIFKKKYNSELPVLIWQFVIFGHNEHELAAARKQAQSLNMQFIPKFNWDLLYSPVRNMELVREVMGYTSWPESDEKSDRLYVQACMQFWTEPQINWDGRLLGCCVNRWVDFGNVFEKGLKNCLQNKKYIHTKKMLLGLAEPREDIPCQHCFHYKQMRSQNQLKRIYPFLESHLISHLRYGWIA